MTPVEDFCMTCRTKSVLVECDVCGSHFCCTCPVCEAIALNASEGFARRVLGQNWRDRLDCSWWTAKLDALSSR